MKNLPLLQDADLKDKIVLIRVDHNVVKSGKIEDSYRINSTFGTLFNIILKGGKIILMTHIGRPKNKKTNSIEISEKTSVIPIVNYLKEKLFLRIEVPEFPIDEKGGLKFSKEIVLPLIAKLKNNELDIIYLPNIRWFWGEESKDEEMKTFAKQLSEIANVYVNDAFGSWQANASTVGINQFINSYAGLLMQKEINNLNYKIFNAERPFLAVVAGSKFDTKLEPLYALLKHVDKLVLGGVIYNAYLCAKYDIRIKTIEDEDILIAKKFVDFAEKYPNKIVELPYIIESDNLDSKIEGQYRRHNIYDIYKSKSLNYILDVDKKSFEDENIRNIFLSAKTIFVNAVMGFTPNFSEGTKALYSLISQNDEAMKLFGGGDTNLELKRLLPDLYMKTIENNNYYLFTGGGAVLTAIEQENCYGIEPIKKLIEFAK